MPTSLGVSPRRSSPRRSHQASQKRAPHLRSRYRLRLIVPVALVVQLVALSLPVFAQRLPVNNYGIADGLEMAYLQSIVEDERGQLWIAHARGLARFDGNSFEDVSLPAEMTEVDFGAIERDGEGGLCAVSQWTPVRVVCKNNGEWSLLPIFETKATDPERVRAVAAVIGTHGLRVAVLLPNEVQFFTRNQWYKVEGLDDLKVNDIASYGPEIRMATDRGLYRLADQTVTAVRIGDATPTILALARHVPHEQEWPRSMWMLGAGWIGFVTDDRTTIVHENLGLKSLEWPVESALIGACSEDGLYFGTTLGFAYLDLQSGEIHPVGREEGLAAEGANDVLIDRNGQVWIAGYRSLAVIQTREFENFTKVQGLLDDEVASMIEISPGHLLIGQNTGFTDFRSGKLRTLPLSEGQPWSGDRTRVMELTHGSDGTVWAAAYSQGFLKLSLDPKLKVVESIVTGFGPAFSIQRADDGRFWAVAGSRLLTRESEFARFELVELDRPTRGVRRAVIGIDGRIWVLTDNDLIFGALGSWQRVSGPEGRESNNFFSLWPLGEERAWVGTAGGLFEFAEGDLRRATLGEAIIDRPVYAIVVDEHSRLWCGTDDGVYVWDGKRLRHMSIRDGLPGGDVNRAALICDSNGDVWIGSDGGISHYKKSFDTLPPAAPSTEIVEFAADGETIATDRDYRLPQGVNDVLFRFRPISLYQGARPLIQCRLEGYDSDWSPARQHPGFEYRYTNLPSGIYRFLVRSGWDGGPWSEVAVSGEITVQPPLWRSPAALVSVSFLIAASAFAILRRTYVGSHDQLTGLSNRRTFYDRLERAFTRAERKHDRFVAVLLLDLDRFKLVTQSMGRGAGRALLKEVAARLRKVSGTADTIARLEADDFAVMLEEVDGPEQAMETARRLQGAFSAPLVVNGQEVFTTACIGVALGGKGYRWGTNLLRVADIALQQARAEGLGRVVLFDAAMRRRVFNQLRLEADLRRAIDRNEFELVFQPIVDVADLNVLGLEALLRWRHPVSGLLQPGEFLVAAEETGLIVEIGGWVMEEGLRTMKRWRSGVFSEVPVALHVNLSPKQLEPGDLPDRVTRALTRSGMDGSALVLEITERLLAEPTSSLIEQTQNIRAQGVRMSIDDFGVGHSSLGYLRDLPVDQIKLDRSFITRTTPRGEERKIVETILALGNELDLEVVVEGVEQLWQHRWLRALGCRSAQGYFYAKPLSADVFDSAQSPEDLVNELDASAIA